MSSIASNEANDVLQEAYQDIVELINVDEIISLFFAMKRITLPDFELLQNFNGNLTSHQRKIRFYVIALGGKGQQGLDAFLKALDETAKNYEPHAVLAENLRTRLSERLRAHRSDSGGIPVARTTSTASECSSVFTPTETGLARHQKCASIDSTNISDGISNSTTCTTTLLEKVVVFICNVCVHSGMEEWPLPEYLELKLINQSFDHPLCKMISLKMIILGNVGVGKTALLQRFLRGTYSDSLSATVGGIRTNCYLCHKASGKNVKLSIWDTAGQERFDCITPSFYQKVDVVIMVFDMTDNELRKSLHAVEDWNTQLRHYSSQEGIPIILAGNKCKSAGVNKTLGEYAEHMVKELGFHSFMEVSAKENFEVETLFAKAVTLALEFNKPSQEDAKQSEDTRQSCLLS